MIMNIKTVLFAGKTFYMLMRKSAWKRGKDADGKK